jgi:hypothetical protein
LRGKGWGVHCAAAFPNYQVVKPLGSFLTTNWPREAFRIDIWSSGPQGGDQKLLTVRDLATGYTIFRPIVDEKADTVTKQLTDLFSIVGQPKVLVADHGAPFVSYMLDEFCNRCKIKIKWVVPLVHRTNGATESAHREFNRLLRALISEYNLRKKVWNNLLPCTTGR